MLKVFVNFIIKVERDFKQISLVLFVLIILTSCNVTNKSASSIKPLDGYIYFEQKSPDIKIQLLGDYFFQPLKTKYFRDIDKRFIKYITLKYDNKAPKILYKAHTIIQPFYSTVCLQYQTSFLDTTSFKEINNELKDGLNSAISEMKRIECGGKDVFKIKYQVTNSINKIYSSHTEYFFRNGNYTYRILFWTTDSNDEVISYEAEKIIENIRF